jgi:uncharacterized protein (TIGR02453 family)
VDVTFTSVFNTVFMKTESKFTGFSPAAFRFLSDLEENNYKVWFDANKLVYESELLQPLKALAAALTPSFYEVDALMEFRPTKMISRIYRDIRFSIDKTPYKTCMWIMFQRPFMRTTDDWTSFPGYYLEISRNGAAYGMGLFQAKKKIMDIYRDQIEYDQDNFKAITENLIGKCGFEIGGEEYKRPFKNDLPDYFQPWIQRKGIYLHKQMPVGEIFYSSEFVQCMEKEFAVLSPLYKFFVDVCD